MKMYIIRLFCVFIYFEFSRNFVDSAQWVDDLVTHIVNDSEFHQVKLMTRLDDNEIIENPLFDELCEKLMQNLPTMRINFGKNFELPLNSVPDETVQTRTPIDTAATLFLFVIESRNSSSPIAVAKNFIDAIAEMASYHYSPKYLMISLVPKQSDSFEKLLEYAWTKKMLDFTIIESVQPEVPRRSILIERPIDSSPMYYRLNSFKREYIRNNRSIRGIDDLFPSKVDNLWGHPIRIRLGSVSDTVLNQVQWYIINTIIEKLNGSKELLFKDSFDTPEFWLSTYIDMKKRNLDLYDEPVPYLSNGWNHTLKTVPTIIQDEFCALVPIKQVPKSSITVNIINAFILSFSIILIFWLLMKWLSFKSYPWRMFNIGRVLFGISISQQPRGNVERIVFACLLAISAIYSSMIYASLTNISLETEDEVEFNSLAELDDSGLIPHVQFVDGERTSSLFNGPLKKLGRKKIQVDSNYFCPIFLDYSQDIVCFMSKKKSNPTFYDMKRDGRPTMKFVKSCFWSDHYALIVGKRSPYRPIFDKLIIRFHSSGLVARIVSNRRFNFNKNSARIEKNRTDPNYTLHLQLMAISVVGFSLSFFVFCGEIIYHRISMYIESRVRALCDIFPVIV